MTSTAKPNPFVRITQQNHRLLKAIQKDDFDGFISLDPTQNQAVTLIHAANECIVRYPQGSFPLHVAYPMVYTTMHLIRACEKRYGRVKVKAMGQSFRNLFRLWFYAGAPRCPGKVFVKKIFDGENQLLSAICEHNRGIEEAGAPQPVRKAASVRRYDKAATRDWTQKKAAQLLGISARQLRSYKKSPPDAHWPGWEDPIRLRQWMNQREDRDLMAQAMSRALPYRENATERARRK